MIEIVSKIIENCFEMCYNIYAQGGGCDLLWKNNILVLKNLPV